LVGRDIEWGLYYFTLVILCWFLDVDDGARYKREFADCVNQVIAPSPLADSIPTTDTVIYPLVQMGPANINVDERVTSKLFRNAPSGAVLYLASGYFNLTDNYRRSILDQCTATFEILTAAPEVMIVPLLHYITLELFRVT